MPEASPSIITHPTPEATRTGYVQVYTGDGKGKTTAAFGLALRAAGAGLKVFIAQFVKQGEYSEVVALHSFSDSIICRQYGRGCFIKGHPEQEDAECASQGFQEVRTVLNEGEFDVVILDELNIATFFGLISMHEVLALIDERPKHVELVITGRRASQEIIDRADLVTDMREVRHYYSKGVLARKGIEN